MNTKSNSNEDSHSNEMVDEENLWLRDRIRTLEAQIEQLKESEVKLTLQQRTIDEQTNQLTQKSDQISGLLKEGEILAKKELKANNSVKKLQTQLNDAEKTIIDLRRQLTTSKEEAAKHVQKVTQSADAEKRLVEQLKTLRQSYEQMAKKRKATEAENIELKDNKQVLQVNIVLLI
ncbi:hypothetical protein BDF19DRAFT_230609 [Syncephalis fuscata]|nr:hypothetical protein BDF19DRAFT_230609 [Syncephalis fuscata]